MTVNTTVIPYPSSRPEKIVSFSLSDEKFNPIFSPAVLGLLDSEVEQIEYLSNCLYLYLLWSLFLCHCGESRLSAVITEALLPVLKYPKWRMKRIVESTKELAVMERNLAVADRCEFLINIINRMENSEWKKHSRL